MNQLSSIVRIVGGAGVALWLSSACGGKAFEGRDGSSGSSAQGGSTSHAGSTANAGATSTAGAGGAAHGGSGAGGRATAAGAGGEATAGAGGTSGYAGEGCTAALDPGPCQAYLEIWYHDAATGICRPSFYGGCGGNANHYSSLEDCQKACPPANPSYDSCTQGSDCVVASSGCCGVCDTSGLSRHDFIAYNQKYAGAFGCGLSIDSASPPGSQNDVGAPIACAPCESPGSGALRNFVPDCVEGQCVVVDLRESPVTACADDGDCRLRGGTKCCESCRGDDLIAVRNDGSFEKLVCGGAQLPCPACAPQEPIGGGAPLAVCSNGRCEISDIDETTTR